MVYDNIGLTLIITITTSVLASSGLWAFVTKHSDRKSAQTEMLLGLAHDRIIFLGLHYIERGYITADEYENLHDYLYLPYCKLHGNGSAERIMVEVKKLRLSKHTIYNDINNKKKENKNELET